MSARKYQSIERKMYALALYMSIWELPDWIDEEQGWEIVNQFKNEHNMSNCPVSSMNSLPTLAGMDGDEKQRTAHCACYYQHWTRKITGARIGADAACQEVLRVRNTGKGTRLARLVVQRCWGVI